MTTTFTETYTEVCNAVEHALATFTGEEEPNQDTVDLVSQRVMSAVEAYSERRFGYYRDLLESATTYIRADMSEDELNEWVEEIDDKLGDYGLI
jgi:hypothetical protein